LDLTEFCLRTENTETLEFFQRSDLEIERKADDSPVTVADREAEKLLRREILAAFPDDAIIGEEFGERAGDSGYRWILDPIDGTKSFVRGVPLYGTLVGVERDGQGVVGVLFIPPLDECVYASQGQGAHYARGDAEPRKAAVSARPSLSEALFVTTETGSFDHRGASDAYRRLENAAALTRTWGDCYGYLLVATGRAEVMIDPIMNVWDAAAIQPILEEAGGVFTDWGGEPTIYSGEGIGANRLVIDEVLAITRAYAKQA
jgi:histidinol phosphatase-like enzyme (inositol monophosphatase family)